MVRTRLACITTLALLILGCQRQGVPTTNEHQKIPSDVTYSVIEDVLDSPRLPYKRSLFVLLNKKVSSDVLPEISLELTARESPRVERHIVQYYLPGWNTSESCWALTDDILQKGPNPLFLGLTIEQEESIRSEPAPQGKDVVGRWISDKTAHGSGHWIFRDHGKYFLTLGTATTGHLIELKEMPCSNGLDLAVPSYSGDESEWDHYLIDPEGNLVIRNYRSNLTIHTEKLNPG
jgi:hypothetical protein